MKGLFNLLAFMGLSHTVTVRVDRDADGRALYLTTPSVLTNAQRARIKREWATADQARCTSITVPA